MNVPLNEQTKARLARLAEKLAQDRIAHTTAKVQLAYAQTQAQVMQKAETESLQALQAEIDRSTAHLRGEA